VIEKGIVKVRYMIDIKGKPCRVSSPQIKHNIITSQRTLHQRLRSHTASYLFILVHPGHLDFAIFP
jgi:hypothetical protein